ncbi:MAG: LamG-like jellyroll fold domain-containing protein [bacterium]
MRVPTPSGAWTLVTPNVDLTFEQDLNQLQWMRVNLPQLSVGEEALVIEGNDVRVLAAGVERWYGQIRRVNEDPMFLNWEVRALGKEVLARDRSWSSRREWVNLPPGVILDEVLGNVMDEELRKGLVIFYDMETLADNGDLLNLANPGTNDGVLTGTTPEVVKWGLGRRFDGVDDIIDTGLDLATGSFSLSIFINPDALPSVENKGIFDKRVTGNEWRFALLPSGLLEFVAWETDAIITATDVSDTVLAAVGHFVGFTWDGTNGIFYLDGEADGTVTRTGNPVQNTAAPVRIGRDAGDADRFWDGPMDHAQVYEGRVLTAAQMRALHGRSIYRGGLLADIFDPISFRAEEDTRLNIADGIAKAIGADWFTDRDANDRDRFRLVKRRGSPTATDTFALRTSVVGIEQEELRDTIRNDVIALGYGDGQNQLTSRIWHATTIRDTLTTDYTATSTGPISIASTTTWPANGVVKLGGERILYTGKTATQLGTTSVVRAYTADGYDSLPAYLHKQGIAAWLHVDTVASPNVAYDPSSPQTGSSIELHGHVQGRPEVDRGIIDQNTLDRLAQRLLETYRNPRDSVFLKVGEDDIAAEVGDDVDLEDSAAAPLFASPYRLFRRRFRRGESLWELDLGGPRDVREAELARIREEMRLSRSYGQGATNMVTVQAADNIKGATTPPGIPLVVVFEVPSDAVFVNEVRVLTLAMQPFRSYVGSPDIARTSSEVSTGSHGHTYNRPSHVHGAAGTLDIPDATTTSSGSPPHTHAVTYVAHAIAAHAAEDPAQQQTSGQTGSGVGHNHGGNVGLHSHGAPAAGDAGATIVGIPSPDRAKPDQDITTANWTRSNSGIPFWDHVDDEPISPGDGQLLSGTTIGANLELGLEDLADPLSSTGHILRVRADKLEIIAGLVVLTVEIVEGSTVRSTDTMTLTTTETTFVRTLSAAEANSIGDYTNLRIRCRITTLTGDNLARIESAEFEVPGHAHGISTESHTHGPADTEDLDNPTTGNSSVGGSHDHSLDPDASAGAPIHHHSLPSDGSATGVTLTVLGHSHTWTIAAHDHLDVGTLNEPSLTTDAALDSEHDHSMQGHVHIAGIFETPYLSPSVGLRINGTDRTTALGGPWTSDQTVIDISEFIGAPGTFTLEFFEQANNKLGRLFASVRLKFFIQSGVG